MSKKRDEISDLLVFRLFLFSEVYRSKMINILNPEYFSDTNMSDIVEECQRIFRRSMKFPKNVYAVIQRNKWNDTPELLKQKEKLIDVDEDKFAEILLEDYLADIEKWLKQKAFYKILMDGYDAVEKDEIQYNDFAKEVKKIEMLNFDEDLGLDISDTDKVFTEYLNNSKRVFMGDRFWDSVTTGIEVGSLNVGMGLTHIGKTRFLVNKAYDYAENPNNTIVYFTLEMNERQIAEKLDAFLMDMTTQELYKIMRVDEHKDIFRKAREEKLAKRGKIIIKKYPASTAHVGHFASFLQLLRHKGINPNIVIIDYMGSGAVMGANGFTDDSHRLGKLIAEQYRDFAEQEKVILWTVIQTYSASDKDPKKITMFDAAGSKAISAVSDMFVILLQSTALAKTSQQLAIIDKNRHSGITNVSILYNVLKEKYRIKPFSIIKNRYETDDILDGCWEGNYTAEESTLKQNYQKVIHKTGANTKLKTRKFQLR